MVWYDLTNITNVTSNFDIVNNINNALNGYFGVSLLVFIFFAYLIWFAGVYDFTKVLLGDFLVVSFFAGLLWFAGLVAWSVAIVPFIGLVAMIIVYIISLSQ